MTNDRQLITMNQFRFLEWGVYKDAKKVFTIVLGLVRRLPSEYRFELGNQVTRSALSIILNIAEGSGKSSDKELNRFLNTSLGSVHETIAAADVLRDNKFITERQFRELFVLLGGIANQLGGFKKKLKKS